MQTQIPVFPSSTKFMNATFLSLILRDLWIHPLTISGLASLKSILDSCKTAYIDTLIIYQCSNEIRFML
jgi:hypothetical protein